MKRLRGIVLVALAALGGLFSAVSSRALADSSRTTGSGGLGVDLDTSLVSSGTITLAQTNATERYWTPERIARAVPATGTVSGSPQPVRSTTELADPSGPPVSFPPAGPTVERALTAATVPVDAVRGTQQLIAVAVPLPYSEYPDRLNGRVFFTKASGGEFVCSGTVVNSENKSIVWTAGHCVNDSGRFHENWMFIPAYSSLFPYDRPYGVWTPREFVTTIEWADHRNFQLDVAAAVLNRRDGQRIADLIGGQGIVFNQPRDQFFSAFGYPLGAPFDGLLQWRCDSSRVGDDDPEGAGPLAMAMSCDMTGGASGGGWLIAIDEQGIGFVNGVTSYGYPTRPGYLFSPYHGDVALGLFDFVKDRPA